MPAIRTMVCEVCGGEFKARGFAKHQLACKRDSLQQEQDQAALRAIQLPTGMSIVEGCILLKSDDVSQWSRMISACLTSTMQFTMNNFSSEVKIRLSPPELGLMDAYR